MKLANPYIYKPFNFEENKINIFVIENKGLYYKYINELLLQTKGYEGNWILSHDGKDIKFVKNVDIITDLFNIQLDNSKIIRIICSRLKEISIESKYYMKTMKLKQNILNYTQDLLNESLLPFDANLDFDIADLFKTVGMQATFIDDSFINMCCNYMQCMQNLLNTKLFIFINLKSLLNNNDLGNLYKEIFYRKINVLLIENIQSSINDNEIVRLIDNDMCEVY